jgi:hypothetical protein
MTMNCFTESDVQELGRTVLADFDRRLLTLPGDLCAPFHEEARQLEAELLMIYRATVMCVRREDDMNRVAARWGDMVELCGGSLSRLEQLAQKHPDCGAGLYYDRVLDLRGKCKRLQEMHL